MANKKSRKWYHWITEPIGYFLEGVGDLFKQILDILD